MTISLGVFYYMWLTSKNNKLYITSSSSSTHFQIYNLSQIYQKISIVINRYVKLLFHNQYRKTQIGHLQLIPLLLSGRHLHHSGWLSYHFKILLPLIRQASVPIGIISVFINSADTSVGIIYFSSKSNSVFHYFQILK